MHTIKEYTEPYKSQDVIFHTAQETLGVVKQDCKTIKSSVQYHIAENFYMVQTFVVFADCPTTVKIKTMKVFNGPDNDIICPRPRGVRAPCMKLQRLQLCQVLTGVNNMVLYRSQKKRANGRNLSRNISYSCIAFYNSDGKRIGSVERISLLLHRQQHSMQTSL